MLLNITQLRLMGGKDVDLPLKKVMLSISCSLFAAYSEVMLLAFIVYSPHQSQLSDV